MSVIEVAIGSSATPGKFRVEVVRSPAGEASAEVSLDVSALLAGRAQFQQTLLVSGVAARQVLTETERAVRDTGQALFGALLGAGEVVGGRYRASVALAADRDEELRIVLRLDAPELAGLPWEAMYDPDTGGYVCRQHQLVRHVPVTAVPPPLTVQLPLRVLGVVSAPRGLAALDSDRERQQLTRALNSLVGQGLAELVWAPEATWDGLHEMLLAGPWHVLHFVGHGNFDSDRDEGVLVLAREDGWADPVEASRFASLLREARPMPRLVVLNSCSGATASQGDLFSGTAAALARSGVAAVTAMQYSISDPAAVAFARGFYAALGRGRGVDEAVSAGRIGILGTSGRTLEWITPAIYLRGHDARLFTLPPVGNPVPAQQRPAEPVPESRPTARQQPAEPVPSYVPAAPVPSRVTEDSSWYSRLEVRVATQVTIIVGAFGERGIDIGGAPDPDDGIAFMYAKDHILTREQYLGGAGGMPVVRGSQSAGRPRGVLDVLQESGIEDVEVRRIVRDIVLLRLNPNSDGDHGTREIELPDVLHLLDRIDAEFGVGIATPDQVLTTAQTSYPGSATEPREVPPVAGPYPAVCPDGGARVRIFVADTGLVSGAAATFPWLAGVQGDTDRSPRDGVILPYGGHGTFVAGVLRCMAPDAEVYVGNIFDIAGSVLESELVTRLDAAFGSGFEILHLSASCTTRKNIPLLAMEGWLEMLQAYQGVVCVAPAGNNRTRRPSWPGAFPDVISVGALAADGNGRADFSDYGGWVNVYGPGQDLINAFGSGTYICQIPPDAGTVRTFTGLARWSGTSFSAAIVTGLIAARMASRGESGREAAVALLAEARTRAIPGVGPALLPHCGD